MSTLSNGFNPRRIQRSRARGWRMPAGAVYVGSPSRWGSPIPVTGGWINCAAFALGFQQDEAGYRAASLHLYRQWLGIEPPRDFQFVCGRLVAIPKAIQSARGKLVIVPGTQPLDRLEAAEFTEEYIRELRRPTKPPRLWEITPALRGRDLACWCPLDRPCHADVLLEIANADA